MIHIALVGDSIFDNASYVGETGTPVIEHLTARLRDGSRATLLAVDGSIAEDVAPQLAGLPPDATHVVVSAGGNDALRRIELLDETADSVATALLKLAAAADSFREDYHEMLRALQETGRSIVACTVYYPRFGDPRLQRVACMALAAFNEVILLEAIRAGIPVVDLRLVCDRPDDYANEIEPSTAGGAKIAAAIHAAATEHDFASIRTSVWR
jgi:hypothetical protein